MIPKSIIQLYNKLHFSNHSHHSIFSAIRDNKFSFFWLSVIWLFLACRIMIDDISNSPTNMLTTIAYILSIVLLIADFIYGMYSLILHNNTIYIRWFGVLSVILLILPMIYANTNGDISTILCECLVVLIIDISVVVLYFFVVLVKFLFPKTSNRIKNWLQKFL